MTFGTFLLESIHSINVNDHHCRRTCPARSFLRAFQAFSKGCHRGSPRPRSDMAFSRGPHTARAGTMRGSDHSWWGEHDSLFGRSSLEPARAFARICQVRQHSSVTVPAHMIADFNLPQSTPETYLGYLCRPDLIG